MIPTYFSAEKKTRNTIILGKAREVLNLKTRKPRKGEEEKVEKRENRKSRPSWIINEDFRLTGTFMSTVTSTRNWNLCRPFGWTIKLLFREAINIIVGQEDIDSSETNRQEKFWRMTWDRFLNAPSMRMGSKMSSIFWIFFFLYDNILTTKLSS